MACHVFGTPVTDATLKGMTEYHDKTIEAVDRAKVALEMKNAEGKDADARAFAESVQKSIDKKGVRCLIYNATGGPLKLVAVFDYLGSVSESPFPSVLQNGQWAALVHEKANSSSTSVAAVIYEATQSLQRQWVVGWFQRDNVLSKCCSEMRPFGYYSMASSNYLRQTFRDRIESSPFIHITENNGDAIFTSIGNTHLPIFEAILTQSAAME
ncbi:hypothetical protein vseg_008538 [Gypsophila vaccaria]